MILKRVTPKALKVLNELGLLDPEKADGLSYQIYLDTEKLKRVCDVMFDDKIEDYENLDLKEFTKGYADFFGQLLPNLNESKS